LYRGRRHLQKRGGSKKLVDPTETGTLVLRGFSRRARWESLTDFEELKEIMVLAVNISDYGHGCWDRLAI